MMVPVRSCVSRLRWMTCPAAMAFLAFSSSHRKILRALSHHRRGRHRIDPDPVLAQFPGHGRVMPITAALEAT